jgi:hypothetical protein
MRDTSKKWAQRVAAWRASGLSSTTFCRGRNFTAGGLRHWAHRLRKQQAPSPACPSPPVRLVRVVRRPTAPPSEGPKPPLPTSSPAPSVVLESHGVRIGVQSGFDAKTLESVLDVLDRRLARSAR